MNVFFFSRTTAITGYLPQELIGSSAYEFFYQEDLNSIALSHRQSLLGETVVTDVYRFRCKGGHLVPLKTKSTVFRNPWSKELEFIVCVNTVVTWVCPAFLWLSLKGAVHTRRTKFENAALFLQLDLPSTLIPGGVLPCIRYIGCRPKGYGFWAVLVSVRPLGPIDGA